MMRTAAALALTLAVAGSAVSADQPASVPAATTTVTGKPTPRAAPAGIEPAVVTSAAAGRKPAVSNSGNTGRATDRVELENTQITGNRELPKVMYVVPWKKPDLGDFTGRPAKSLLDELLAPVDRDVFKRQVRYFEALRPDTAVVAPPVTTGSSGNSGAAAPRTGDEK